MKVTINGHELSEAQKAVLRRGYCILHLNTPKWTCSDLTYREWSDLVDANFIAHQKSCLMPDDNPDICWERYRVTAVGQAAVQ